VRARKQTRAGGRLTPPSAARTTGSYIVKVTFEDEKGEEYWFHFTAAVA